MVSTITARLVSLQYVSTSSTSRQTVATKHEQKPHATSATKRLVKHRNCNPFSSVECHRREQAEMNYRAATANQVLAKAGRSSCSSPTPSSALPIGIDLSLVQVVPSRDHDALHSPNMSSSDVLSSEEEDKGTSFITSEEPKNDFGSSSDTQGPAAPSNAPSDELSTIRTSSDPDCYDMDYYSGLLSSTRVYYGFGGTKTSPTPNNSQPKPTDYPTANRRRAPGFKPTYYEVVASVGPRSSSSSLSDQTGGNLDSDNASDTSSSGVSSDGVNSEDEISSKEKPTLGEYQAVVG